MAVRKGKRLKNRNGLLEFGGKKSRPKTATLYTKTRKAIKQKPK